MYDAEGHQEGETCPECGSDDTVTYRYREGFEELECRACGYRSDAEELAALQRFGGDLLEDDEDVPPPPMGRLEA